jgi:hypothetical protein
MGNHFENRDIHDECRKVECFVMIELTEEQRQAIAEEQPPTILDPTTRTSYVLLRREVYERLKNILDEDDSRLMAPLIANLDPEDWEDASAYESIP